MSTDLAKLRELLARVESATGPDRKLEYGIARMFIDHWKEYDEDEFYDNATHCPRLTSSIDAAVQLCERVLPGWIWDVTSTGTSWVMTPGDSDEHFAASAATPAIALCAAILRAKIAQLETA